MSATPTPAPVRLAAAPVDALTAARTAARVVPPLPAPVPLPSQALEAQPPSVRRCDGRAAAPGAEAATAAAASAAMIRRPAAARRRKADLGMGTPFPPHDTA